MASAAANRKDDTHPLKPSSGARNRMKAGNLYSPRLVRLLQLLVLAGLLVTLGLICFNLKFWALDLDLWVHLRVGDWIVQPGPFLTPASSRAQPPIGSGLRIAGRMRSCSRASMHGTGSWVLRYSKP
jgi:hypothetical protein